MLVWSITLVELALRFGLAPDRCFMLFLGLVFQSLVGTYVLKLRFGHVLEQSNTFGLRNRPRVESTF